MKCHENWNESSVVFAKESFCVCGEAQFSVTHLAVARNIVITILGISDSARTLLATFQMFLLSYAKRFAV